MNIFAVVKKAINSNLDKPLDVVLGEIKSAVSNVNTKVSKVNKARLIVSSELGATYNATVNTHVLRVTDDPLFSVSGVGRIFQVIPVYIGTGTSTLKGTAMMTIDDDVVFNNQVRLCTKTTDNYGFYMVDTVYGRTKTTVEVSLSGEKHTIYTYGSGVCMGSPMDFGTNNVGIIAPQGVPFVDNFKIRMTQSVSNDASQFIGVIVVYELYE